MKRIANMEKRLHATLISSVEGKVLSLKLVNYIRISFQTINHNYELMTEQFPSESKMGAYAANVHGCAFYIK
jgi:hypothetical protein